MNKYLHAMGCIPVGTLKAVFLKLSHPKGVKISLINIISPFTEISMGRKSRLHIGKKMKMRCGSKMFVRENAEMILGDNVFLNYNCILACHEKIVVGDNVQFSPNVLVYDHDHDFRAEGGLNALEFKTSPVKIDNNVWIGANSVILRGTELGDNCVVAAGTVVKGKYPENCIIYQEKKTKTKEIC